MYEDGEVQVNGGFEVKEPLSRERVLAAAVALVDADGMAALTMRRVAADLGVEAMSLYYHLPGKDGLLDGLVETVIGEVSSAIDRADAASAADASKEWHARLRRWFLAARVVMLSHPWAPALLNTRRQLPPAVFAYYERILAILIEAGFSYHLAHRALHAFGSMPLGFVQEAFSPTGGGTGDGSEAGPSEADLAVMLEHFPHAAAMVAAEVHRAGDSTLGWCDSQAEFEFTLDLLLDGLDRAR